MGRRLAGAAGFAGGLAGAWHRWVTAWHERWGATDDEVVAEWQHRRVGDLVFPDAKGSGGWYVMDVQPNAALVLQGGDVRAGRPVRRDEQLRWEFSWSFVLRPATAWGCRLLVRERTDFGSRLTETAMSPLGIVSFMMTQKMLREIRARAESRGGPARRALGPAEPRTSWSAQWSSAAPGRSRAAVCSSASAEYS